MTDTVFIRDIPKGKLSNISSVIASAPGYLSSEPLNIKDAVNPTLFCHITEREFAAFKDFLESSSEWDKTITVEKGILLQ